MSYDLPFKLAKAAKPLTSKQRESLITALRKVAPGLKPFKFDHAEIAKALKITVAQARKKFSHAELNDDKSGIQVMIQDKQAYITIPFSLGPRKAKQIFKTIGGLGCELSAAGFTCKDPQQGRKVDFTSNLPGEINAMTQAYASVNDEINSLGDADLTALLQAAIAKSDLAK